MNFGKSVKKLASEFNVGLSLYKSGKCKTNSSLKTLEKLKWNEVFRIPISAFTQNINLTNLYMPYKENLNSIIGNVPLQKKIQEPGKTIKITIKLPVGKLKNDLDLPCSMKREIQEPVTNTISKKAHSDRNSIKEIKDKHIISIRRRKMRVHKRKKYMKKHKIELMKKKAERKLKKEFDLHVQLKDIIKTGENFSPEEYLNNTLKTIHWKRPVTKVRGILAPQWVIKDYLNQKEEDRMILQRLEECINSRK